MNTLNTDNMYKVMAIGIRIVDVITNTHKSFKRY